MPETNPLGLLVQVENSYNILRAVAHVQILTDEGLLNPNWDSFGRDPATVRAKRLAGFQASAYLGDGPTNPPVWGRQICYKPSAIYTAEHARAMAQVLERLQKGLDELNTKESYLDEGDLAGYLIRIARVLKLRPTFFIRNSPEQRAMCGDQWYREISGSGLQHWVEVRAQLIRDGKIGDLYAEARN